MRTTSSLPPNRRHRLTAEALGLDPVEMYDAVAAAAYLGGQKSPLSPKTLANWRCSGLGPRFCRVGGRVRYARADMDAWLAERLCGSTSDVIP